MLFQMKAPKKSTRETKFELCLEWQVVASSPHTAVLFQGVSDTQQALLADKTGEVRGHIVYTVLQEAANHPQV